MSDIVKVVDDEGIIEGRAGDSLSTILGYERTDESDFATISPPIKSNAAAYSWSLVLTGIPLCLSDIAVVLATTTFLGYAIVAPIWGADLQTFSLLLVALSVTCPLVFYMYGLYPGVGLNSAYELQRLCMACTMLTLVSIAATTAQGFAAGTNTLIVALAWPCCLIGLPLARWIVRSKLASQPWWGLRTIVLGFSSDAEEVYDILKKSPAQGLKPTGFIDDLHSPNSIREIANDLKVQHAVIAISDARVQDVLRLLANGDHGFLQLTVIPSVNEPFDLGLHTIDVGGHTLGLVGKQRLLLGSNRLIKRISDIAMIILGGIFALPCVLGIMLAITISSRGPIFYKDLRIGRHGRKFYAWKFRTMVVNADQMLKDYLAKNPEMREEWERDIKLKNDPRITTVGRFLRRTSLDELPQLWNVLNGEMSLVGPRPILPSEADKYADVLPLYTKVLPGITGLWQVSGRNNTTYRERITLVASYVRNWSLWLDICILAKTIIVVIRCDGAY